METVILQNDHIETGGKDDIAAKGDENTEVKSEDMEYTGVQEQRMSVQRRDSGDTK